MAIFYPHKQTIIIVTVCALLVGGTAYYVYGQKAPTKNGSVEPIVVKESLRSTENTAGTASDEWKKQFFAAETSSGATKIQATAETLQSEGPLTLTDRVGRNFFTNYVRLQQGNLIGNEQALQNAANYTIEETVASAPQPKTYTSADIRISSDDAVAIRAYGNAVASAFATYAPRSDAITIAVTAFENGNTAALVTIDSIILGYQKTISAILAIPTPPAIALYHLGLINGLSAGLYIAQGLRAAENDPMQGLVALGIYGTAQEMLRGSLKNIRDYFNTHSIVFSTNEPGIAFASFPVDTP